MLRDSECRKLEMFVPAALQTLISWQRTLHEEISPVK